MGNLWRFVHDALASTVYLLAAHEKLFGSAAFAYDQWLLILGVAMTIYLIVGLEKLVRRFLKNKFAS